jgi:iron uptake system component EfeO
VVGWKPDAINLASAFKGLQGLMQAQEEKVNLAAEQQEESRYSQRTMSDLRHNLSGTTDIYGLFTDWLSTKANGLAINAEVEQALDMLGQIYGAVDGAAIPDPPPGWDSTMVSPADQQTPFGMLYRAVLQAIDLNRTGSVLDAMNHAAKSLGLSQLSPG